MKLFAPIALFTLALGGCSAPAEQDGEAPAQSDAAVPAVPDVDAAVAAYYEPYTRAFATGDPADWDRPIFSAAVRQLIERWKAGFNDQEVAELQDFAWLCECQDWDHTKFRAVIAPHAQPAGNSATVDVALEIGWGEKREAQLQLVAESGKWMIDDIRSQSFPEGLKAALAAAIEHDAEAAS